MSKPTLKMKTREGEKLLRALARFDNKLHKARVRAQADDAAIFEASSWLVAEVTDVFRVVNKRLISEVRRMPGFD